MNREYPTTKSEVVMQNQVTKKVVEAEEFVLVDNEGQRLAVLARNHDGGASLCFFDQAGTQRCLIGVDAQGTPLIKLGNPHEQTCLSLSQTKGETGLKILDHEGKARVQVGVDGINNNAFVTLGTAPDKNQLVLFANEDGSTSVILHDSTGSPILGMRVHPNGNPAILTKRLGNILQVLDGRPKTDSKPLRPQGVESIEDVFPTDDHMIYAHQDGQPDAWEKSGIVY